MVTASGASYFEYGKAVGNHTVNVFHFSILPTEKTRRTIFTVSSSFDAVFVEEAPFGVLMTTSFIDVSLYWEYLWGRKSHNEHFFASHQRNSKKLSLTAQNRQHWTDETGTNQKKIRLRGSFLKIP